jgi:hypothetical protein
MFRCAWLAAFLFSCAVHAQWFNYPAPGVPRLANGKVNLTAPAPRAPDGKPDLGGVWKIDTDAYFWNIADAVKPAVLPMQPWAEALFKERDGNFGKDSPVARCLPPSLPGLDVIPAPFRIVQTPHFMTILYEYNTLYRQIFVDGRPLPKSPNPSWMGYSSAKWDGDTLVVESSGFNDQNWLDGFGHPMTGALHVTERFHRTDFGHMDLTITIDDPKVFTKPWTFTVHPNFQADTEPLEWVCAEEKLNLEHIVGK